MSFSSGNRALKNIKMKCFFLLVYEILSCFKYCNHWNGIQYNRILHNNDANNYFNVGFEWQFLLDPIIDFDFFSKLKTDYFQTWHLYYWTWLHLKGVWMGISHITYYKNRNNEALIARSWIFMIWTPLPINHLIIFSFRWTATIRHGLSHSYGPIQNANNIFFVVC